MGIYPEQSLIEDAVTYQGDLQRGNHKNGKQGKKPLWLVSFGRFIAFGNWQEGSTYKMRLDGDPRPLTKVETTAIEQSIKANEVRREQMQLDARRHAINRLSAAGNADPLHAYLVAKGIDGERLAQEDNKLLVPITDCKGAIWSYQTIEPNGRKLFPKGAKKKGNFWAAGWDRSRFLVGEGVATMKAIRRATGATVIAAMDAGNLPVVAEIIHLRLPSIPLVICADDDQAGHVAAEKARELTGAQIVLPGSPI
ncbi:MAG: toprim domain-containing protein [Parasphingorhabdus sp.]|uniref:toprim domain-containing protein n=1 Tax=Parasphingorhabdus sp. TaxID=2709688 RepID=UPI00329A1DBB